MIWVKSLDMTLPPLRRCRRQKVSQRILNESTKSFLSNSSPIFAMSYLTHPPTLRELSITKIQKLLSLLVSCIPTSIYSRGIIGGVWLRCSFLLLNLLLKSWVRTLRKKRIVINHENFNLTKHCLYLLRAVYI